MVEFWRIWYYGGLFNVAHGYRFGLLPVHLERPTALYAVHALSFRFQPASSACSTVIYNAVVNSPDLGDNSNWAFYRVCRVRRGGNFCQISTAVTRSLPAAISQRVTDCHFWWVAQRQLSSRAVAKPTQAETKAEFSCSFLTLSQNTYRLTRYTQKRSSHLWGPPCILWTLVPYLAAKAIISSAINHKGIIWEASKLFWGCNCWARELVAVPHHIAFKRG